MSKHPALIGLIIALVALLLWLALFWEPAVEKPGGLAIAIEEMPRGGDFVLQSRDGPVTLEALKGKVVVLYFGYTWCPDICPTSLGFLSVALNELTDAELSRMQSLFVSVDPQRDTLERLKDYGEYFHPNIKGVTGTPDQLKDVTRRYGAAYSIVKQASATDYVVDHTADLYIIDQQGRLIKKLAHGTPPEEIFTVLRGLLNNT